MNINTIFLLFHFSSLSDRKRGWEWWQFGIKFLLFNCSFLLLSFQCVFSFLLLDSSNFCVGEDSSSGETKGDSDNEWWSQFLIVENGDTDEGKNEIFESSSDVKGNRSADDNHQEDVHGDDESEWSWDQKQSNESTLWLGGSEDSIEIPEISLVQGKEKHDWESEASEVEIDFKGSNLFLRVIFWCEYILESLGEVGHPDIDVADTVGIKRFIPSNNSSGDH